MSNGLSDRVSRRVPVGQGRSCGAFQTPAVRQFRAALISQSARHHLLRSVSGPGPHTFNQSENDMEEAQSALPEWVSHKRVWAAKIVELHFFGKKSPWFQAARADLDCGHSVTLGREYLAKHQPQVGGYYVRYQDGYESWSPAEAFEGGYTRVK